ncbi:MAG: hypothetical protein H7A21_13250 [Spirochaetales bacterium]|nr:hypothetical protein [Leptospiraceae bacterium]MCP5482395.1 hypothetical protein [Spirochaetales bacterium]MCP5484166.1 hypothetical protein [Spirochaetales bacterium]
MNQRQEYVWTNIAILVVPLVVGLLFPRCPTYRANSAPNPGTQSFRQVPPCGRGAPHVGVTPDMPDSAVVLFRPQESLCTEQIRVGNLSYYLHQSTGFRTSPGELEVVVSYTTERAHALSVNLVLGPVEPGAAIDLCHAIQYNRITYYAQRADPSGAPPCRTRTERADVRQTSAFDMNREQQFVRVQRSDFERPAQEMIPGATGPLTDPQSPEPGQEEPTRE